MDANNSINFATHFRPTTFNEVVGQDIAKSVLKKIAMADGISVRSIFIKGSWGSGKSTLCRIFARALNCKEFKKTGDVCNECQPCKEVLAKNSQLYFEFDSSVVGNVERIRQLQEQLSYIPEGRRLVVFDECHAASVAAQNAMLKMIEEGIQNTIFMFASTDDVIPTIRSRSLCLEVTTIAPELIKQRLFDCAAKLNIQLPPNVASTISVKCGGHMRDALSMLQLYTLAGEEGITSSYQTFCDMMFTLFRTKNVPEQLLSKLLIFPIVDVRNSIQLFLRNCYIAGPTDPLVAFQKGGIVNKLFSYFYSPLAQSALKDEVGTELLLRSLIAKINGGTKS